MSDPFDRPFFTLKEAAEYFRITKLTLYRLAKLKKIPAFKVGGQWRFKKDIAEQLFTKQTKEQTCIDTEMC